MSRADDDRFDSMYLSLAQQNQGIDNLFESFFGFLRRKTDYYTGASEATLEEKVLQVRDLGLLLLDMYKLAVYKIEKGVAAGRPPFEI